MKTINGYPTKKAIKELCDKHALIIHVMDNYKNSHSITWYWESRNERARMVADDIAAAGFKVFFYPYDKNSAINGIIRIEKND